jgi:transposase, mutator family
MIKYKIIGGLLLWQRGRRNLYSTFEPKIVKKCQKDILNIDKKIISMYAKEMTTRQISETTEDIYGFETS